MIQWFAEEIDIIRQDDCGFSYCSNKYVVFLRKKVVPLSSVPIDVGLCVFLFLFFSYSSTACLFQKTC